MGGKGAALVAACAASVLAGSTEPPDVGDPTVRVLLASAQQSVGVSATGAWRVYDAGGSTLLFRPSAHDTWTFRVDGARLSGTSLSGLSMGWRTSGVVLRPVDPGAVLAFAGKRYRGELAVLPSAQGMTVVNRVGMESYLRGVVPLEIGDRRNTEMAAVKAQAVAARSYALTRIRLRERQTHDVLGTVADQVYGGAGSEKPLADAAIEDTRGMVVMHGGRSIDAPYHASCGGSTATVREVWQSQTDRPYLQRVNDRIPGSDRFYCDIAPRFTWERTFDGAQLDALVDRYLRTYAPTMRGAPGRVRSVSEAGRTASGRLSGVTLVLENGTHVVRGNDMRFVLRAPTGEILPSTYVSLQQAAGVNGRVERVTMRGRGNGHGIGMCQWGAIGRARAGQSWQEIIAAYYPGTTVETAY